MTSKSKPQHVLEATRSSPASTWPRSCVRLGCVLLYLCAWAATTSAQSLEAHLSVVSLTPPRLSVEGRRDAPATVWSFRTTYAGLLGLGARIEQLTLTDARGAQVGVRQLAPGEYEAERPAVAFRYEVNLAPPNADADAAHVSWLTAEQGILLPGDLLPLPAARARLRLTLPAGWQGVALDEHDAAGVYELSQAESSVFLIGPALRVRQARAGALPFTLATDGAWAFTDEDLAHLVQETLQEYVRMTESVPRRSVLVIVSPFPRAVAAHVWSAETRGGTALLLTGRVPSKNAALAQLSAPLAHELFHLWMPNALSLRGDYDWFFEGFTLYAAERAGVRLGQLNFQNYLDNLALAYDRSRGERGAAGLSLLDASKRRWSDQAAAVYYKGMLAAYLYDLSVRLQTGGRRALEDVYRALFHNASTSAGRDANAVVLEIMNEVAGGPELTKRLITTGGDIDLAATVQPFGLQVVGEGAHTRVLVALQLSRAQRALLKQIGYNETAAKRHR